MISFSFFLQSWFTNQIVICIATLYHGSEQLGLYIGLSFSCFFVARPLLYNKQTINPSAYCKHYFTSILVLGVLVETE